MPEGARDIHILQDGEWETFQEFVAKCFEIAYLSTSRTIEDHLLDERSDSVKDIHVLRMVNGKHSKVAFPISSKDSC